MQKEYRIYLNDKLKNLCYNQYALMCNVTSLSEKYGKNRVKVKECAGEMDQEKREFLKNYFRNDTND